MSKAGRIVTWGSVAALLYSIYYFRGDLRRYTKMKLM